MDKEYVVLNKFQFLILLFFTSICIYSCGSKIAFEQTHKISEEGWAYEQSFDFVFEIEDSTAVYDLVIDVEHSKLYSYSNLYVKINTTSPSGFSKEDIVSFNVANNLGLWEGKCNSVRCIADILLQKSVVFNELGTFTITFEQFSREQNIVGINSLTLKLIKV